MSTPFNTLFHKRYFWMELAMLVLISYFFLMVSGTEFYYYVEDKMVTIDAISYALIYSSFEFALLAAFYWGLLKPNVMGRRPWIVLLGVLLLIPCIHLWRKYVIINSIRNLPFLAEQVRAQAEQQYQMIKEVKFIYAYNLAVKVLPMVGFAYLVRAMRQDEQLRELKEQQLMSELNYLRAQLQPHFFFNTLNNIYGLALDGSKETAPLVAKLAEMMRYMLYRAQQPMVPLVEEVSFLRSYVDIERIRHHDKALIGMEVQGSLDEALVAPLILLPFVENAFKHGVNRTIGGSFVEIVLLATEDGLCFQGRNSRPALVPMEEGAGGIGLQNVRKRLDLLYPDRHSLVITEEKDVYQVNLSLSWKA